MIVADRVPKNPLERIAEFIDPSLPVDVEPRVYTTGEFLRMAGGRRFAKETVAYGKLLAGDPEAIEAARRRFEPRGSPSHRGPKQL